MGTEAERIREALDRWEGPLMRYAARLLGDVERARDLVQETYLRLCAKGTAQAEGHLAEWLFTVCRNLAMDELRRKPMSPLDDTRAGPAPAPPEALQGREERGRLLKILSALPGNQQEVLRLKFQEGLAYKEISRITSLSVSNVGFLIHTGLKALRQAI